MKFADIKPDLEMAASFIEQLTGNRETPMTFQTFDDDQIKKDPTLARCFNGKISDLANDLIDLNKMGAGIFVCPQVTDLEGRKTSNIKFLRAFFIDKDNGVPEVFHQTPNLEVKTPQGGHYYWLLKDQEDPSVFKDVSIGLIKHYDSDPVVKDIARVMRLPGFFHLKNHKKPTLIRFKFNSVGRYDLEDIALKIIEKKPPAKIHETDAPTRDYSFLTKLPIHPGERNSTALRLIRSAIAVGKSKDEIAEICSIYHSMCKESPEYKESPIELDELLSILERQWDSEDKDTFFDEGIFNPPDYFVKDNKTYRIFYKKDEECHQLLANFQGKIIEEQNHDDGVSNTKHFLIEATNCFGEKRRISVLSSEFSSMSWVEHKLGARFIIEPRVKDYLRAAIQKLSMETKISNLFAYTGFVEIDRNLVYLMPNGCLDEGGLSSDVVATISLQAPPPYGFPKRMGKFTPEEKKCFIELLMRVAEPDIAIPLLIAPFRAVLSHFLPCDFSLYLEGPSGSKKSSLVAIPLAFFGKGFDRKSLTTNWTGTVNAIEAILHIFKDTLIVIDDFAPRGSSHDVARMNQSADRIFRNVGNQGARARLTSTAKLRPSYLNRGLVAATGEDLPTGHSIHARIIPISIDKKSVDVSVLSELQNICSKGVPNEILSDFILWILKNNKHIQATIGEHLSRLRQKYMKLGSHSRFPENMANLGLGLIFFKQFCESSELLNKSEMKQVEKLWIESLKLLAAKEQRLFTINEPADHFIELLKGAFQSNLGYLADKKTGDEPSSPSLFGWRSTGDKAARKIHYSASGILKVGWVDADNAYLLPDAALAAAKRFGNSIGENFALQKRTLHKRLADAGYLLLSEKETFTPKVTVEKKRERVLVIPLAKLDIVDEDFEEESPVLPLPTLKYAEGRGHAGH